MWSGRAKEVVRGQFCDVGLVGETQCHRSPGKGDIHWFRIGLEEADSPLPRIEERHHSLRGFVFQRLGEEAIDNDVEVRFKILMRF